MIAMEFFAPETMSWQSAALRFAFAVVLPLLIGLERFFRQNPLISDHLS